MIVDQAVYRDGSRQPCTDLSTEIASLKKCDPSSFLWIGLKDPTPEEFDQVKGDLGLHPLAVEDALQGNQRSKIERYDDSAFVVLKTLHYFDRTSLVETGEVMLFVGPHFVVTVRSGQNNPLSGIRHRLEHSPELLAHGSVAVLHTVMDDIVDEYQRVEAELSTDLDDLEQEVFSGSQRADASQIYQLKREVLEVRRAADPLAEPLRRLMDSAMVPQEAEPFFRDVHDHLCQVIDHIDSYDRLLTDILNAHLAQVSVRQNEDMRKISSWAAILAAPTLIAGIYGMNFERMPELTASIRLGGREFYYGYYLAVLTMIGVGCWLHHAFRRNGWL